MKRLEILTLCQQKTQIHPRAANHKGHKEKRKTIALTTESTEEVQRKFDFKSKISTESRSFGCASGQAPETPGHEEE